MSKFIIGNWKMNPATLAEAENLTREIELGVAGKSNVKIILCPPYLYLSKVRSMLHISQLGAQNVSNFIGGAHTGEVSAKQLKDIGADYAIIGHSECRE